MDSFTKKLDENVRSIQKDFRNDETLVVRSFENQVEPLMKCCLVYMDGMVNSQQIDA